MQEGNHAMTEPTNAVVPVPQGAITFGQSNLTGDQLIPPRVKIVQAMSEERAAGAAEAGEFWNTLTSENLGSEIKFLPITTFMNRVFLVRGERRTIAEKILKEHKMPALSEGDGLKCRSLDMEYGNGEPGIACNECPLSAWHGVGNQEPPPCSEVYNVAAVTELGDLVILQFQRSSAKAGKKFFSMLRFAGVDAAPWDRFYRVTTHEESIKGKGSFFVPTITRITDETVAPELRVQAGRWYSILGGQVIDVTPTEDEETEVAGEPVTAEKGGDEPF